MWGDADLERLIGQLYEENDFFKKGCLKLRKQKGERERLARRRQDS